MSDTNERSEWLDVVANDGAAFGRIFDRHQLAINRYVCRILGTFNGVEDVVQDVFITAWDKRHTITLVGDSVLPWLLATAKYKAYNESRRRWRKAKFEAQGLDHQQPAPLTPDRAELHELLAGSLATLNDDERAIVSLCLIDGVSYDAAAKALNVSVGSLRNRLSRARNQLRIQISRTLGSRP